MIHNSKTLRAICAAWLRYTKQCPIVTFERGLNHFDRPDVLAVTDDRRLIEIEIKISFSDFKADAKKDKWRRQKRGFTVVPAYFYYCVTEEIAPKVLPLLPDGAGLIVPLLGWSRNQRIMNPNTGLPDLKSLRKASRAHETKLSQRQIWDMVRNQSGTICGMSAHIALQYADKINVVSGS